MIHRLELTKKLILVVRVLNNNLYEIDVSLNDSHQEIIALLEAAAEILLLQIQRTKPGLKHGTQNAKIVAAITDFLHMTAQNDELAHPHILRQLSQLFIIHDSRENTGEKSLSLTRITLGDIRGNHETQDAISQVLQLFIVRGSQGDTIVGTRGDNHFLPILCLLLP